MSRYRKIDPRIWNDAKFAALSDSGKLVFFMLLTHPSMTALGAMRATLSGLAEELGWTPEAFREAFQEVIAKDMAEHDPKACLIALSNFIKYNPPESPNVIKAWASALDLIPECSLKSIVISRARDFAEGLSEGFSKALPEAFAKTLPKNMPYQEQEQEQEQEEETSPDGEDATGGAGDLLGGAPPDTGCPHREIVALYHEMLPELTRMRSWEGDRQTLLRSRWREDKSRQNLDWWRGFFRTVKRSPFLLGQEASGDRAPFLADLEWLIRPKNFRKVLEGKYLPRRPNGSAPAAPRETVRNVEELGL